MGTVSNPASFSSIRAAFGGTDPFSAYYRGGPHVPISSSSGISTTANGLSMSQFNGVSSYINVTGSASPSTLTSSGSKLRVYIIGETTVTGANGNGSYTYSAATLVSGVSSGAYTNITVSQSGNVFTFKANLTSTSAPPTNVHGVWGVTVSDGTTSVQVLIAVYWN